LADIKVPFYSLQKVHEQTSQALGTAFTATLKSNWFVLGEKLRQFENAFAEYLGCKYVIGVANGLEALQLALMALYIGKGDEVLVPAHTFAASFLAVINTGAKPVPVDVEIDTGNLNVALCKKALTSKTKAIMPVHLYGNPCQMDAIKSFAKDHNLWIIEDNAQAVGATYNGKRTGTFGHVNACSFYPSKTLGALGDAGAISTNDEKIAERLRRLRNYGSSQKYAFEEVGLNARMDEIQAAFLIEKLPFLNDWNEERRKLANYYAKSLSDVSGLTLPVISEKAEAVWHIYAVRTVFRNELQQYLKEKGIQTAIHYPQPPHLQKAYYFLGYKEGDYPVSEKIAAETLSLPLFPGLDRNAQNYVIDNIKSFFKQKVNRL